jgi:hypothetical protein
MMQNATPRETAPDQSTRLDRIKARLQPHRARPERREFVSSEATTPEQTAPIDQLREELNRANEESLRLFEASVSRLLAEHAQEQAARVEWPRGEFHRRRERLRSKNRRDMVRLIVMTVGGFLAGAITATVAILGFRP